SGYRVIDANGIVLAHVYSEPDGAAAPSDARLTNDEARRISKLISRLRRARRAGEGSQQGQEPSQAPAPSFQAGNDRRPDPRGETFGGPLRQLPARAASLSESRNPAVAEAHARPGGGKSSGLQQMQCPEQRDLYADLGETRCEGRRGGTPSGLRQ